MLSSLGWAQICNPSAQPPCGTGITVVYCNTWLTSTSYVLHGGQHWELSSGLCACQTGTYISELYLLLRSYNTLGNPGLGWLAVDGVVLGSSLLFHGFLFSSQCPDWFSKPTLISSIIQPPGKHQESLQRTGMKQ